MKKLLFFLFILTYSSGYGQETERIPLSVTLPDTVKIFSIHDFYKIIFANHPVIKQAELLDDIAKQEIRFARGAFDPKLEGSWDVKEYNDTEYFNILNASLRIPTWFPVDPKVSVDRNRGVFLNPQNFISESTDYWQYSAGFNITLGQGLFLDERRATLRQAMLYQNILQAEQVQMINDILLEAAKDYWNWYNDYYNYLLLLQSIELADNIFTRVKLNYEFGEASVIDTIQAKITLQNRITDMLEARISFVKSGLILSNYLWDENEAPLDLKENVAPALPADDVILPDEQRLERLRILAFENHPELLSLQIKREQLLIDTRLSREFLKPALDLSYNFINAPLDPEGDIQPLDLDNNYKLNLTFGFPLFLRKERAKIQLNEIKVQQNIYEANLKRKEIITELSAAVTELINTRAIIIQQRENAANYVRLLEAELFNLELGESDLFRINYQQDQLIEAQLKLIKLNAELQKAKMYLLWAAGVPNLELVE